MSFQSDDQTLNSAGAQVKLVDETQPVLHPLRPSVDWQVIHPISELHRDVAERRTDGVLPVLSWSCSRLTVNCHPLPNKAVRF